MEGMAAILLMAALLAAPGALESARDRQDRAALERQISELSAAAQKSPHDADAQYRVALASSYLDERSHAYRQPGARCPVESGQSIEIVSIECIHRSWTAGLLQPNAVSYAS